MSKMAVLFGCLMVFTLLPLVQAQTPPPSDECLAYAFTRSEGHSFLMENNTIVYGNQILIKTNCETFNVYFDDIFYATYDNVEEASIFYDGINVNMTITSGNYTYEAQNVVIFQNQFTWSNEYQRYTQNLPSLTYIEMGEIVFKENVVAVSSILIVWFLSVNIYWILINHYLDRRLFEEVVE